MFRQKSFIQIFFSVDFGHGNIINQGKKGTKAYDKDSNFSALEG